MVPFAVSIVAFIEVEFTAILSTLGLSGAAQYRPLDAGCWAHINL
jgi:hypothetical protein